MCHYSDDVVQRKKRVALDLCVHVLPLGAQSKQLHEVDVVHQRTGRVEPVTFRLHQLQQCLERVAVVVEQQNFFTDIDQLIAQHSIQGNMTDSYEE